MRGTQSLLYICAACWKRPSLLGWELLWRWGFGIPAAAILYYQGSKIVGAVPLNRDALSLSDPLSAGQQLTTVAATLTTR